MHTADAVRASVRQPRRRRLSMLLSAALAVGLVTTASPIPAAATTTTDTAAATTARILASMNAGRNARGLVRYQAWAPLPVSRRSASRGWPQSGDSPTTSRVRTSATP